MPAGGTQLLGGPRPPLALLRLSAAVHCRATVTCPWDWWGKPTDLGLLLLSLNSCGVGGGGVVAAAGAPPPAAAKAETAAAVAATASVGPARQGPESGPTTWARRRRPTRSTPTGCGWCTTLGEETRPGTSVVGGDGGEGGTHGWAPPLQSPPPPAPATTFALMQAVAVAGRPPLRLLPPPSASRRCFCDTPPSTHGRWPPRQTSLPSTQAGATGVSGSGAPCPAPPPKPPSPPPADAAAALTDDEWPRTRLRQGHGEHPLA